MFLLTTADLAQSTLLLALPRLPLQPHTSLLQAGAEIMAYFTMQEACGRETPQVLSQTASGANSAHYSPLPLTLLHHNRRDSTPPSSAPRTLCRRLVPSQGSCSLLEHQRLRARGTRQVRHRQQSLVRRLFLLRLEGLSLRHPLSQVRYLQHCTRRTMPLGLLSSLLAEVAGRW